MNSLRTDDILGAKPRVRHMPKNLIRERGVPTSFLTNLNTSNPEFGSQMYQPDSPIQYQNNDGNGYPFYARNRLTKESRYVNYDFPSEDRGYQREMESNSRHELNRVASENKYQANQPSSRHEERRLDESNQNIQEDSRSKAASRRSMQAKQPRQQSKRLFRGLGFNIITNHKYEYTFQHKLPNL